MITVKFEKSGDKFRRRVVFPDGSELCEANIDIPPDLYAVQEVYPWEADLHERSEDALLRFGQSLAELAIGIEGQEKFRELTQRSDWNCFRFIESPSAPETACIPWELMNIDGDFVATHARTRVERTPEGKVAAIKGITLGQPMKMALVSAAPSNQVPLLIEQEQIRFALTIGQFVGPSLLDIDEILHCTREKLARALQRGRYDILYFTGHGVYQGGMGYLCLEQPTAGGTREDLVSSAELTRMLPTDRIPNLVFLNCCQSGASNAWRSRYNSFRDLGRALMNIGVPEVVATLTPVFDTHAQVFMRIFFDRLLAQYDVGFAVSAAREALRSEGIKTFYQYLHLTQTSESLTLTLHKPDVGKSTAGYHFCVSPNHPALDKILVNRSHAVSEIEDYYVSGIKAVMVTGIGGVGKTAISVMLERRLVNHYDHRLRVEKTMWLDLRENHSLGELTAQISRILRGAGNNLAAVNLTKQENIESIDVSSLLIETFGNRVLLALDNCETLLDEQGHPEDPATFRFIIGLVTSLHGWKVLLTSREPFDLTIDGRRTFDMQDHRLGSLTPTERVALLQHLLTTRFGTGFRLSPQDSQKIIAEVAGNPYELELFVRNLTPQSSDINALIEKAHKSTGEYAYLDYYVGRLSQNELELLHLLSVFETPPNSTELAQAAAQIPRLQGLDVNSVLALLVSKGLVETNGEVFSVPTVLSYYLFKGTEAHCIAQADYQDYSLRTTQVYYELYKKFKGDWQQSLS